MAHCPNCGAENRDDARFCKECQAPMGEPYVQVSEPAQQPAYKTVVIPEEPAASKKKTGLIIGGVTVAILLCCIACIFAVVILYAVGAFKGLFGASQATAKIMPADTGFYTMVNPRANPQGLQHLTEVYEDILQDMDLDEAVEDVQDELDISFEEDVRPWVGPELSVAIPNLEDATVSDEAVVVIGVVTRDRKASDAFLEKLGDSLEDEGYDVEEETYNDVSFYVQEAKSEWDTPVVFGTVGNVVVFTSDVDAFEDVIDTQRGNTEPLTKNTRYTKLQKALPSDASMTMFIDFEDVLPLIEDAVFGIPSVNLPEDQLEAYEAIGMAVSLDEEGIQIDMAVTFDPDKVDQETLETMNAQSQVNPGRILQEIPADAIGFVSSQDLAAVWQTAFDTIMENPDAEEQIEALSDSLGLDVDEDLLSWATGEYALALVQARGDLGIGGFFIIEVDDEAAAEDTMDDIVDAIEDQGTDFDTETIKGVDVEVLLDPYSEEIMFGYAFVDGYLIIGYSEDGLEQAVGDFKSMASDEAFKAMQAHLPRQNSGYFYVSIAEIVDLIEDSPFYSDDEALALIEPIKAIGGATEVINPNSGVGKATLFIYIP